MLDAWSVLRAEEHELDPLLPDPVEIAIILGLLLAVVAVLVLVVVVLVRLRRRGRRIEDRPGS